MKIELVIVVIHEQPLSTLTQTHTLLIFRVVYYYLSITLFHLSPLLCIDASESSQQISERFMFFNDTITIAKMFLT
jgi:hypothetical protein